jgi:hypothetical protein
MMPQVVTRTAGDDAPASTDTRADERVGAERAVERARHQFGLWSRRPFDETCPRSTFEKRVAREIAEEAVLGRLFGLYPTSVLLAREFDRIETFTKAAEQWRAAKQALGDDRRLVQEVICRPLFVNRLLRTKFAFDARIHVEAHETARQARFALLAGEAVSGSEVLLLPRGNGGPRHTEAPLGEAGSATCRLDGLEPAVLSAEHEPLRPCAPVATLLQGQLHRPGDVSTIVEWPDRFEVFRLIEATEQAWKVDGVRVGKVAFEDWFERVQPGARALAAAARSRASGG